MSDYGKSTYGDRLDFKKRPCRDCCCALIYYLHVAAVIAVVCYFYAYYWEEIEKQLDTTPSPTAQPDPNSLDWTGVYVAIPVCAISGLLFGLIWLQVMRLFASFIIKLMLILNCIAWIVLFIIGIVYNNVWMMVICGILAVIWVLYTICVWSRVAFSTALLEVSSKIAGYYKGTICVAITIVGMDLIWLFLWGSMMFGYVLLTTEDDNDRMYAWEIFLMLVSLYWGCSVNTNVGHTTYCGVAAVWFFSNDNNQSPSCNAFWRSMTSQFGSICLGSLMVAILEALRAMISALNNEKCNCILCCILCCLRCIEWAINYFNKYAYAHCAIYGTSFMKSAAATWQLFGNRGIMALINDDLTGSVLFAGSLMGAIVTAAVGFGIGWIYYHEDPDPDIRYGMPAALAVYGGVVGCILCICTLTVVKSGIVSLFVCYAEAPAVMRRNHPEEFDKLVSANAEFGKVDQDDAYGGNVSAPIKTADTTGSYDLVAV
eukprot:7236_1